MIKFKRSMPTVVGMLFIMIGWLALTLIDEISIATLSFFGMFIIVGMAAVIAGGKGSAHRAYLVWGVLFSVVPISLTFYLWGLGVLADLTTLAAVVLCLGLIAFLWPGVLCLWLYLYFQVKQRSMSEYRAKTVRLSYLVGVGTGVYVLVVSVVLGVFISVYEQNWLGIFFSGISTFVAGFIYFVWRLVNSKRF